jgi:hypothetical protein
MPTEYPPYTPDGHDIAQFLGQADNPELVAMADQSANLIVAMIKAYTRGEGFNDEGIPNDELSAVVYTATARLLANPEQLDTTVGGVRTGAGFSGWSLAETFVLNRYRRRAQ